MKPASALSGWFAFPRFAQGTFTKTREPSRALVSQETLLFFLSEHSPSSSHLLGSGEIYCHIALIPSTLILGEWMSL